MSKDFSFANANLELAIVEELERREAPPPPKKKRKTTDGKSTPRLRVKGKYPGIDYSFGQVSRK